jgi:hypothetical protein
MHGEHEAKSHDFPNFLKQVKPSQRVKILKNHFGNLQMGTKNNHKQFYF